MRRSNLALSVTLGLASAALTSEARANAMVTHVWVAEQAIERAEPAAFRDIVADASLRAVIQNGAIYQDSGYSVRHDYGEWAHWESFIEPYLQWIRARWGAEGYRSPDARRHVAFLMGLAAHSMTDQTFDQYFVPRVRQYDRTDANDLDVASDTWLVIEGGVTSQADGRFWFDEMPAIHAAVNGPAVTPEILREASDLTVAGTRIIVRFSHTLYPMRWRQFPWGASHYTDPNTPGSYPQLVRVTAAYWNFLWQRLQGTAPHDAPPLMSWPAPDQTNYPVDHNDIESRVVVTTPWGLDDATVNATTVRILDANGAAVPARFSRYGGHGSTLMLRPESDLAYNSAYRVELAATVRAVDGVALGRAITIPFRTRCAPDRLADCPPIPTPRPTLSEPPVRNPMPPAGMMDAGSGIITMVNDAGVQTPAAREEGGCRAGHPTRASGLAAFAMTALALFARSLSRRRQRAARSDTSSM